CGAVATTPSRASSTKAESAAITLAHPHATRRAIRHLKRVDPAMGKLIAQVGACGFQLRSDGAHFDHLTRAIVYQQLSGQAAATIHSRIHALYGGRPPTPAELASTPAARLPRAGLSRPKLAYLKDLARRAAAGPLPLEAPDALRDESVIETLTAVRGVGVWTAQMFLMFRLGRLDILPVLDLGIQKGIRHVYGLRRLPSPAQMERIAAPWRPYRSVACWYLWRALDVKTPLRPERRSLAPDRATGGSENRRQVKRLVRLLPRTLLNRSPMRVCHPGPVALQRSMTSAGRRREINFRGFSETGRPPLWTRARASISSVNSGCSLYSSGRSA